MCTRTPKIPDPIPAPAPPPVLEQVAPKVADGVSQSKRKRSGFSAYKTGGEATKPTRTSPLGGIPKKTGV